MIKTEFNFLTEDGLSLYGWYAKPSGTIEGVIALTHGMGEHSERYFHLAEFFLQNNYAFISFDHRGHGRSQGKRGHTPSLDHLLNDITRFLEKTETIFPGIPVIFYGHSMGGNLALNYAIRKNPAIKGMVITAPYIKLAFEPPIWKVKLAEYMTGIFPGLTQSTKLDTKALSRDPEVVERYKTDPLVHDKMSAGFFMHVHYAGLDLMTKADRLKIPTLIMHGADDKITSAPASEEFARNNPQRIHYKSWPGLFHEIHNEFQKQEVFDYTLNWIKTL